MDWHFDIQGVVPGIKETDLVYLIKRGKGWTLGVASELTYKDAKFIRDCVNHCIDQKAKLDSITK